MHRKYYDTLRNNGNNEDRSKGGVGCLHKYLGKIKQMICYKTYTFSKKSGKLDRT